jgi:putative peptidoglycan lipid II flippase
MNLTSLFSAGMIVTIGMIVGRILGLLREVLLASHFGVHPDADTAILLLMIPDFIMAALILGPASATLIPAFAARDTQQSLLLFWQSLLVGTIVFLLLALLIASLLTSIPFFLAMLALPLSAATSVLTAYLQFRGRFMAPAFANALFNSVIIVALWSAPSGLTVFSLAILMAGLVRLLAHWGAFFRAGGTYKKPQFSPWQLRAPLLKTYAATASSGLLSVLPLYTPYAIIAAMGGSIALFNYTFKLVLLPGLLLQSLVQMVLLPWLVKTSRASYGLTLQCAWLCAWVMCLALSWVGAPLAALCFGYGKMTAEDIVQIGHLFSIGVWAMPGMVLTSVWQQILYANARTGAVLMTSSMQAFLAVPLCAASYALWGIEGVLFSTIIIQILPVFFLAKEGVKRGITTKWLPSRTTLLMTVVSTLVFVCLIVVMPWVALGDIASVMTAFFIGAISLIAGLWMCDPIRVWVKQLRRTS